MKFETLAGYCDEMFRRITVLSVLFLKRCWKYCVVSLLVNMCKAVESLNCQ